MTVEIKVLGPLGVTVAGVPVATPTANKQRQMLAMFALNAGQVLTVDMLMEELWDRIPPRSAMTTIQTYILKLRRLLRDGFLHAGQRTPPEILVTRPTGYLLDVAAENVDAIRYGGLSAAGRKAVNDADYAGASKKLIAALGLWRASALVDVSTGPQLRIEAIGLEESRMADLGLRIDLDLRFGRHDQLLSELATLCARYPLVEMFCAQFMLALYRAGRLSQALQVFQRTRDNFVQELGLDPSARLRQLHQAMLASHPSLHDPDFVFSGRTQELAAMTA